MRSYSQDLRKRVLKHLNKTKDVQETSETFDIHQSTIYRWLELKKETGKMKPRIRSRFRPKKFSDQDLRSFIQENPDATLLQIGKHFNVKPQSVFTRLRSLKITRKKNNVIF